MSIRLPQQTAQRLTLTLSTGAGDNNVSLPQDTDNVTIFAWCTVLGATSIDLYFQTSYDGGTTWYDLANTQFAATVTQANARVLSFSTLGQKAKTGALTGSNVGNAASSSTVTNNYTGLNLMGQLLRVKEVVGGSGASTAIVDIIVNQQSATA